MTFRVTHRKEKLLEEIIRHEGYVTSRYLSDTLGVSSRTVRQDLRQLSLELQRQGIELEAVPSKGYCIGEKDREKGLAYLRSLKPTPVDIPTLPPDRVRFIIRKVLFGEEEASIVELADELCVSRSTVEKDIQEVRKWFAKHELFLFNRKSHGLSLKGSEISIRYAMLDYFWSFYDFSSLTSLKGLKEIIGEDIVERVKKILYRVHDEEEISLSDGDFINLVIYLSVSLARVSIQKEIIQIHPEVSPIESRSEFKLAAAIAAQIEEEFSIRLPQAELIHLTTCLMQTNVFSGDRQIRDQFKQSESLLEFIGEVTREIKERFNLDFSGDEELANSMAAYLDSLISRNKYKTLVKDPGMGEIIKEYPDALEMAVTISEMVKEKLAITINEHEIGYMALYLCAAIERYRTQEIPTKKKVLIICATGSGGSQLLAVKVRHNFPEVQLIGIYPAYRLDEAIQQNPDLIISTIPVQDVACPVVHISHLLNEVDQASIRKAIDEVYTNEQDMDLISLFRPELFFVNITQADCDEVIRFMCAEIEKAGCVDPAFTQAVLERESVFPTAIGNLVAIPHAMIPEKSASWIAVGILKKPIAWGNDLAQLILLLNIVHSSDKNFTNIYEKLYKKLNAKTNIEKLIKSSNFDHFVKVINE